MNVLNEYKNKNIVVGSHGTALSTIINYYDQSFGYADFENIRKLMPWIVRFTFQDTNCINIQMYDLFEVCGNRNSNR
jgi:2,3-bisphosphoglycerate-dependent phosphoglycerate mutase